MRLFVFFIFYLFVVCIFATIGDERRSEKHREFLSVAINDFGFRLLPELVAKQNNGRENVIYSPLSITLGLSMAHIGAASTTAMEIENCLFGHEFIIDKTEFHQQVKLLIESMEESSDGVNINLANSIWLSQSFNQVHQQFKQDLREYYSILTRSVDFSNPDSFSEINRWVTRKTQGKIEKIIEEDAFNKEIVLILANVLYFKGLWQETFLIEKTYRSKFYTNSTSVVYVNMMKRKSTFDMFVDDVLEVEGIKVPYANNTLSMFVILPQERDRPLSQIYSYFTSKQMDIWERSMVKTTIALHLPKFKTEETYQLQQALNNLGIKEIFSAQNANLSGISDQQLHVSSFVHKVFIEVNEQGTEASVVSAMHISKRSLDPEFIADHPFIFYIKHMKTNTILFLGEVNSPGVDDIGTAVHTEF